MVTVFLSILNQMEFHLVLNRKENCHHDHIPFNGKGIGNIVLSVNARSPACLQMLQTIHGGSLCKHDPFTHDDSPTDIPVCMRPFSDIHTYYFHTRIIYNDIRTVKFVLHVIKMMYA